MKSSLPKEAFITAAQAIDFNKKLVAQRGENHAILDKSRLQNAMARPINRHVYTGTKDVCVLAAALIYGLSKAHAFEQGNKRTAFVCGLRFLQINGFGYHGSLDGMQLGLKIIELCENSATEKELEDFLRTSFVYRIDGNRITNKNGRG